MSDRPRPRAGTRRSPTPARRGRRRRTQEDPGLVGDQPRLIALEDADLLAHRPHRAPEDEGRHAAGAGWRRASLPWGDDRIVPLEGLRAIAEGIEDGKVARAYHGVHEQVGEVVPGTVRTRPAVGVPRGAHRPEDVAPTRYLHGQDPVGPEEDADLLLLDAGAALDHAQHDEEMRVVALGFRALGPHRRHLRARVDAARTARPRRARWRYSPSPSTSTSGRAWAHEARSPPSASRATSSSTARAASNVITVMRAGAAEAAEVPGGVPDAPRRGAAGASLAPRLQVAGVVGGGATRRHGDPGHAPRRPRPCQASVIESRN